MIETWYNSDKNSKKEIAVLLHKSERTIKRKINHGLVAIRNYDWTECVEYSARLAQDKYEYCMTSKAPVLKLDQDIKQVETWINNYPRSIFEYKRSNMILLEM